MRNFAQRFRPMLIHFKKVNFLFIFLITLTITCLVLGTLVPFTQGTLFQNKDGRAEYMNAFLNLAGILLFIIALLYQNREYSLQVEELKKSVDAQSRSSEALEQQKNLLVEQNTNILIFSVLKPSGLLRHKRKFRNRLIIYFECARGHLKPISLSLTSKVCRLMRKNIINVLLTGFAMYFAKPSVGHRTCTIFALLFSLFIIFSICLTKRKYLINTTGFTPLIHIHFSLQERMTLYLTNTVEYGMPTTDTLQWHHSLTGDLLEMLKPKKEHCVLLNPAMLTEEFIALKEKKG